MLNDITCFKAVYIVCGYTDLRLGMERLVALVEAQTGKSMVIIWNADTAIIITRHGKIIIT